MWNTEFGGGNAGGGGYAQSGGFFNTTTTASPSSQEKKKPERLTNVMPCTVAQIFKMPENEENLTVGSVTAKMITLVGLVESVDSQSTKLSYMVNDLSAHSIEVQVWIGENVEMERQLRSIREGTYVKVTGAVRSLRGKRHVIAFKISAIPRLNELTMHILEVIHSSKIIASSDKQSANMGPNFSATGSMMDTKPDVTGSTTFGGSKDSFAYLGLSKPQQLVLQSISACTSEQGMSIHDLFNNIKALNRPVIKEAVEFLSGEGHIYSTIDEDHFKSTESM